MFPPASRCNARKKEVIFTKKVAYIIYCKSSFTWSNVKTDVKFKSTYN